MKTIVELSDVAAAFECGPHEHIAIVGGGGKSTLLRQFGIQLGGARVMTTTTKMGADQDCGVPVLVDPPDERVLAEANKGPVMVWQAVTERKAVGVDPLRCDRWFEIVDHVIVEADGAKKMPFKAPKEYEPVVPSTVTLFVSVIGADAMGRVIADRCFRPLRVAALARCSPNERLSPAAAARVILHERGARREMPDQARFAVAINKVDDSNRPMVDELADALGDTSVVVIKNYERINQ